MSPPRRAGVLFGLKAFLAALYDGCEGLVELRALSGTKGTPPVGRAFFSPDDEAAAALFVADHRARDTYFGVATRTDRSSGKLENCRHFSALFVDIDFKTRLESEAREGLGRFALPPSAIVHSGGGLHVYWFLREPVELRDAEACAEARVLLRRLAAAVGGDLAAAEPARVLRLPGTLNLKPEYGTPRPVKLEILEPDRRYNPSDFDDVLPPEPVSALGDAGPFVLPDRILAHAPGRNHTLFRYGRSLKARGWKLSKIVGELERVNRERCEPPLPDEELGDIAHNVMTEADRPTFVVSSNGHPAAEPARGRPRLTDAGNAQRFAEQHGQDVRYCYAWRAWLVWDETRWRRDEGALVTRMAKATARRLYAEAAAAPSEDRRKALAQWAVYSESEPGIRRMLTLAQSEPGIPVRADELDRDPYLLNTPIGTVELRTGRVRPARREDLISRITAAPYQADARHPVWDTFLERVLPDAEVRAFVQRVAGYGLTASTTEEKFFLVHGPTAGGKSTFLTAMRRALGDYATAADASTFMERRAQPGAPRDDVVKLIGRRLVVSSEVKDGVRLATSLVKMLFGGDPMAGRGVYEKTQEFTPVFKLLIAANDRPKAPDDDDALWRRLYEIPFTVSIPEAERDPAVKQTLCDPAQAGAAILAWAVEGAAAWFADGLGMPEAVRAATREYREAMDPVSEFLATRCVVEKGVSVAVKALRDAYLKWAVDESDGKTLSTRVFNNRLKARGCDRYREPGGGRERSWLGIRLRDADEPEPDSSNSSNSSSTVRDSPCTRAHEESPATSGTSGTSGTENPVEEWL